MVFWHQGTSCKVLNRLHANSVNSDLPAFSSAQATSLWRVLYHKRVNHSPENSGTRERNSSMWHKHTIASVFTEHLRIAIKDFADRILIFISPNVIHDYWSRFCVIKIKLLVLYKVFLFFIVASCSILLA